MLIMELIKLNLKEDNRLSIDGVGYFIFHKKEQPMIIPALCPHRGGPLHLGDAENDGEHITCPWHDTKFKINHLSCKKLPTLKVGNQLTIVSQSDDIRVWHEKGVVSLSGANHEC